MTYGKTKPSIKEPLVAFLVGVIISLIFLLVIYIASDQLSGNIWAWFVVPIFTGLLAVGSYYYNRP
jgi:uncharacterized membrane protein YccC